MKDNSPYTTLKQEACFASFFRGGGPFIGKNVFFFYLFFVLKQLVESPLQELDAKVSASCALRITCGSKGFRV